MVGADTRTVNRVKSCSPAVASASRKASPAKRTSSVQAPESTKTTSVVSPRQLALITCRRTDSGRAALTGA